MRCLCDIELMHDGVNHINVVAQFRTPEVSRTLEQVGAAASLSLWIVFGLGLIAWTWHGGLGFPPHAFVLFSILLAVGYWAAMTGNRIFQNTNRIGRNVLRVDLNPDGLAIVEPGGITSIRRKGREVRFSSTPHQLARWEERDEKRVEHPLGYAYRDAWEVWCEIGLEVRCLMAVSNEQDARTIVRYLSDANIRVTRGSEDVGFSDHRSEPV